MQPALIDRFGRNVGYLRLSVTDRCNLRCFYCLPKGSRAFEDADNWLTFHEIERVVRAFAALGVARVRITGGEPLVRRNLPALVQRLSAIAGLTDLSLSTNGVLLAKQAESLRRAGVQRLNVSLDSLRPERFQAITGGKLGKVLDGLMIAKQLGFVPIKINMLAMKGVNDDEFGDMVEFCVAHGFTLRLIETMPIGEAACQAAGHYLDLQPVKRVLSQRFGLIPSLRGDGGPARYMQVKGCDVQIGFITPMSQHFCASCNRVRLAADGSLHPCLGQAQRVELRPLLRAGIGNAALQDALVEAVALKPERHMFCEKPYGVGRLMSVTGG